MEFARPWFLILLPLAALPFVWRARAPVRYSSFLVLPDDPLSRGLDVAERALSAIVIGAIVLSLAEPRTGATEVTRWTRAARLVFVLDQSASMFSPWSGTGEEPQRKIDVALNALGEFGDRRRHDQLALIGFGKAPVLYTPPTFDHARFRRTVRLLNTDLGDTLIDIALLRALSLLDSTETSSGGQAVILLSDGAGRVLEPERIAARFRRAGIDLHWLVIEGGRTGDERVNRLMEALGPNGRTFLLGDVDELPRALEAVGRLEERMVRVQEHREGRFWARASRTTALCALLALGVFVLGEGAFRTERRP